MEQPTPIPLRLAKTSSASSSVSDLPRSRNLHLLVAATGPRDISWAQALAVRLSKNKSIEMRVILDDPPRRIFQTTLVYYNLSTVQSLYRNKRETEPNIKEHDSSDSRDRPDAEYYRKEAFNLLEWADLLVLAPLDADNIAKMLAGIADTFLLDILRGWDPSKRILLVPGMSTHAWENPITKRQLSKIHQKWTWIRAMPPILWHYNTPEGTKAVEWNGFNEVVHIISNQAELLCLGRDVDAAAMQLGIATTTTTPGTRLAAQLPPELWSLIFEFSNDWELAKALGIYTNLREPDCWRVRGADKTPCPAKTYAHELEWLVLTADQPAICKKLSQSPPDFHDLPALVVRLIIRFSLIDVLTYLEANRPDLFTAFDGTILPIQASAYYGRTDVLDYWKQSRRFRDKHLQNYTPEALDGASKNGFVRVLDWWWRQSGFPLQYTEAALEQASGNGNLVVLEWWRDAAAQDDRIVLRPGRSLLWASQNGRLDVLRWWHTSGIPVAHSDGVAKRASRYGLVEVLELWRQLKGDDKLVFDGEVLVVATVHQHIEVLEWWRKYAHGELPGMGGRKYKVEYRTCNIEEALEDSIGDQKRVRQWWAKNGLNLGLRNMDWLMPRTL